MRTKSRLKELRLAKGHESQREFARFVTSTLGHKCSYGTINAIEKQTGNPSWDLLDILATYFSVSTDYLMGRTDKNIV